MSVYALLSAWDSGTTYVKFNIVKHTISDVVHIFYSLKDANTNNTPSSTSASWGGITTYNGQIKPHFFFTPSYNSVVEEDPKVRVTKFEGYEQRIPDHIDNALISLELAFDLRTEAESKAINHFLRTRRGTESFVFTPPTPYNAEKLFVCRSWRNGYNFKENFTISCRFEEVNA